MNREIKFRGKKLKDNIWVYGLLTNDMKGHYRINFDPKSFSCVVKEDTIGQFTGLYAKSGKEIYEGDILKITEGSVICICVVTWNEEIGAWSLKLRGHTETGERPLGKWLCDNDYDIKVAGNIFDNKEILEYE